MKMSTPCIHGIQETHMAAMPTEGGTFAFGHAWRHRCVPGASQTAEFVAGAVTE